MKIKFAENLLTPPPPHATLNPNLSHSFGYKALERR